MRKTPCPLLIRVSLSSQAGLVLALSSPAAAQDKPPPETIDLRGEWTQFLAFPVAGDGDRTPRYGGRLDGYARIDGESAGLWKGLTINLQAEYVYGQNTNRVGSSLLLPVNTALAFPKGDGSTFDLSYNIVQKIGAFRIQLGKINLIDASSAIPIVGGGGKEGFQHIGLAAPPGLIASPKVFGAIVSAPAGPFILNLGLWSPVDWTRKYVPGGIFDDGVNGMIVALLPTRIGGRQGYYSLSFYATSRRVNGKAEFPDIRPPPDAGPLLPTRPGGTYVRFSMQQYLWQDAANPRRGWGLFGHVSLSSGAPGILDWSMTAGVAGAPPWRSRPEDRFGIGYFRYSLTPNIVEGLAPVLPLHDEQGLEVYYTAQLFRDVRLTADGQLIDPVIARAATAAYLGLRLKATF